MYRAYIGLKYISYLSVASDNSSFICSNTRSAQGMLSPPYIRSEWTTGN